MRSFVFAALALSTSLALPAGAATVLDRSALSATLVAVLTATGQSLVDRLPMRSPQMEKTTEGEPNSVAYSPTGVRWGWTDDGKVCFQPFPELVWPEGLADPPPMTQAARIIDPPAPWNPDPGGDWTGGGTPFFPPTGTGGGNPLPQNDPDPDPDPGPGPQTGPNPSEVGEEPPPAPVPLPAPGILLAAALGALTVVRRRR